MPAKRLLPQTISPDLYKAIIQVDSLIRQSGLDPQLMELVKIRASQINGCGFCLDMHIKAARKLGEDQRRLDVLAGWRETDLFDSAEQAALAWTESVTHIGQAGANDATYETLHQHFGEKAIIDLTILIGLINLFNRLRHFDAVYSCVTVSSDMRCCTQGKIMTGKQHRYAVTVTWTGNTGTGTATYRGYERVHTLSAPGKPPIAGSSDPAFRGDPACWNPEELLLASLAACHKLWYLGLCAQAGIVVTAYEDTAEGHMTEEAGGAGQFTSVTLRPRVTIAAGSDAARALALHREAHAFCFIARSVNFSVIAEPTIVQEGT